MRIADIMLVQRSLDLLRPLSSHGKLIEETGKLNSPLTWRGEEKLSFGGDQLCENVKTDRINLHPAESMCLSMKLFFLPCL